MNEVIDLIEQKISDIHQEEKEHAFKKPALSVSLN